MVNQKEVDAVIARLHKHFSFIVVTVEDMKDINEEFPGLDNAEYFDELITLSKATEEALDYFNDAIGRGLIGRDVE